MTELKVHMDCIGCANKVRTAVEKLVGVEKVEIDIAMQKVTVTGWAEEKKILKAVRKTGKRAEPWPMTYNALVHDFHRYHDQHGSFTSSCNPKKSRAFKNGRIIHHHTYSTYDPHPVLLFNGEANGFTFFSDENPHACSIM
ncbi:hypothetical protein Dimus_032663 [Dionaea muscipula]